MDQLLAEYSDTSLYDTSEGSVALAERFVVVCRILLVKLAQRSRHSGGEEIELSITGLREDIKAAKDYISANTTSGANAPVKQLSLGNFRDE